MSRRKKRDAQRSASQEPPRTVVAPPERWPQPRPRWWMIALSAACVLAWLAFLAYLAYRYGG